MIRRVLVVLALLALVGPAVAAPPLVWVDTTVTTQVALRNPASVTQWSNSSTVGRG